MERDRDRQNRESSQLQKEIMSVFHEHKHIRYYDLVLRENRVLRVKANVGFVASHCTEKNNSGLETWGFCMYQLWIAF